MPKLQQFEPHKAIEDWIRNSALKPHPSEYSVKTEKGERIVEGLNYGAFGIHNTGTGFRVTHLKSGFGCGPDFETKTQAERYVFLLANFENWDKQIVPNALPRNLMQVCHQYCQEQPLSHEEQHVILVKVGEFALFSNERKAKTKPASKAVELHKVITPIQPRHKGPVVFGKKL